MRILFVGGLYRGYRLAQRLVARGEDIVAALAYEEDPHESEKYSDAIVDCLSPHVQTVRKTRRVTRSDLSSIRDDLQPDVIFCLGWRTMIPNEIIGAVPRGAVAVHDSLLPRLRGFAPTNWALLLGHEQLGATLFQLTDAVDAGQIYFQQAVTPRPGESYESIQHRLAEVSVDLFDQYLDAARSGTLAPRQQIEADATFTCARTPADGEIDWSRSAHELERQVRALAPPAPGAFTYYRGEPLVILSAAAVAQPRRYEGRISGRVIERHTDSGAVDVLCGEGILRVERVHDADGQTCPAVSVIRGVRESLGLNYSLEITALRRRMGELENQLASLTSTSAWKTSA